MQYAILKRVAVFGFKTTSKMTLMSRKRKNRNSTFLMQISEFLRSFHLWKNENVQQRRNALFGMLFDGQLQFHAREKHQNDPKLVEKQLLAVV